MNIHTYTYAYIKNKQIYRGIAEIARAQARDNDNGKK
jgi:hypothetical protein